nr:MAG TPA: hypothetical protein [Caudoviricetes sp.]
MFFRYSILSPFIFVRIIFYLIFLLCFCKCIF